MTGLEQLEQARQVGQARLDAARSKAERNRLGQFATPSALADTILEHAHRLLPTSQCVRFLDPALGTGSFFSALLRAFPEERIERALGFEIDADFSGTARGLWSGSGLTVCHADFTRAEATESANLVVCNPPYVRHHHIDVKDKPRLQEAAAASAGVRLNGLSGLYCYFMLLAHRWMADDSLAAWLIPSEFMDVNYGSAVKEYLLSQVTLSQIHRFDPLAVQFDDALVSSAVVWFTKAPPPHGHEVKFTYGGSLSQPQFTEHVKVDALRSVRKWTALPRRPEARIPKRAGTTLGDLFTIRRGVATGANKFFILSKEQIDERRLPHELFIPVLPSPRHLHTRRIQADPYNDPVLEETLFLLNCSLPESRVQAAFPTLWEYLQEGRSQGVNLRYLCSKRTPWYAQEHRDPPPFLCTYMGRGRQGRKHPVRFILNESRAIAANVYLLLYPRAPLSLALRQRHGLNVAVLESLESISSEALTSEARVYGGGLFKMEPAELANVTGAAVLDVMGDVVNA